MKRVFAALLALSTAFAARGALAHAPSGSTSRVSLRDDHIEVIAEWDLFLLAPADPTSIATASEDTLARLYRDLVTSIEAETRLTADGAPVKLEVRGFPAPPELRALAATLSAAHEDHGPIVRIRLEAPEPVRGARTITLASPARLGRVNASFVQPVNRFAEPGAAAAFDVLEPRPALAPIAPPPVYPRTAPLLLLLVAACFAVGGAATVALRNRSTKVEPS